MKFFPVVCGRPTRRLWSQHAMIMLREGRVGWSAYHFADKVHLLCGNHVADTRDGVEHFPHFVVVEVLFADLGH